MQRKQMILAFFRRFTVGVITIVLRVILFICCLPFRGLKGLRARSYILDEDEGEKNKQVGESVGSDV